MEVLRVGLVGFGQHVKEAIVPSLLQAGNNRITKVFDPQQRSDQDLPFGATVAQDEFSLIDSAAVDAVIVAASPHVHQAVAKMAIDARKPVFVEKPAALNGRTLASLSSRATDLNVPLMVGHNYRFAQVFKHCQAMAAEPEFGIPRLLQINFHASKPRGPRWGMENAFESFLLSQATHAFDIAIHLAGEPLHLVSSSFDALLDGFAGDVLLRGESGIRAAISLMNVAPRFDVQATVLSSTGERIRVKSLERVERDGGAFKGRQGAYWQSSTSSHASDSAGYVDELRQFVTMAVTRKLETHLLTDAVQGLTLIESIVSSSRQNCIASFSQSR